MKRKGAALAASIGILAAARAFQANRSVVLTYHGVLSDASETDDFLDHNFVSASVFQRQLDYLCEHYEPIALGDLVRSYETGRKPPRRAVVITFDDGFANNYEIALPLLARRGVPFSVFVTTGMVGQEGAQLWTERVKRAIYLCATPFVAVDLSHGRKRLDLSSPPRRAAAAREMLQDMKRLAPAERDAAVAVVENVCGRPPLEAGERERYAFMTWEQVRQMSERGVELGSHTVNHPILTTLDGGTLNAELQVSKATLEMQLGRECYALAYPNGSAADYGEREKVALQTLGYRCALSLRGTLNARRSDPFEIDRININRHHDDAMFQVAVAGLLGRARRARDRWTALPNASRSAREVRA